MNKRLAEALPKLLHPGEVLLRAIQDNSPAGILNITVTAICPWLDCQACAIFLASDDAESLVLSAAYPEEVEAAWQNLILPIQYWEQSGWLGEAAATREPVRHGRNELIDNRIKTPKRPGAGTVESVLVLPMFDRKNVCLGVIELQNKRNEDEFSDEDVSRLYIVGQILVVMLTFFRLFKLSHQTIPKLQNAGDVDEIYEAVLNAAVDFFNADRGDLVVWNDSKKALVVRSSVGKRKLATAYEFPEKCIVSQVWKSGQARLASDVTQDRDYFQVDSDTQSELAVRWDVHSQPCGVLNLESCRKLHFNQLDLSLMELLGQAVAFVCQVFGKPIQLRDVYQQLGDDGRPLEDTLITILESVARIYGLDVATIFLLSDDREKLQCVASIGCEGNGFWYALQEEALVTRVFHDGQGHFESDHGRLNPRGVQAFGIHGPVVGVPLRFRGEVLGVLVAWHKRNPEFVQHHHATDLETFARIAGANIALAESDRRRKHVLERYQQIQWEIQNNQMLESSFDMIIEAIRSVGGFERVRIYDFRESTQCFECRASRGMAPEFRGFTIPLLRGRYASDIYQSNSREARIYDPLTHEFGDDPDAERLGKPTDLPWAVLRLRINGHVCGQIAADNAKTRKKITQENLDTLTILGGLASQALATDRLQYELRTTRALRTLFNKLALDDPRETVIRRLLVYATCDEALGFSRAVFLERKEGAGRLEFSEALGSLTPERHGLVAEGALRNGLEKILELAGTLNDSELTQALNGFSVSMKEPSVAVLFQPPGIQWFHAREATGWPAWIVELARRLNAEELLVVGVGDARDQFGIIVVDRRWQARDLSASDTRALEGFAERTAVLVLRQHGLYQLVLEGRELSTFGFVVKGLTHDLRTPIGTLRNDPGTLRERLAEGDFKGAERCTERIDEEVGRLAGIIRDLELLLAPDEGLEETHLPAFLEKVCDLSRARSESLGATIMARADGIQSTVRLIPPLLRRAIENLINNALDAFERSNRNGTIMVEAKKADEWIAISVRDDGPGITTADLEQLRRRVSGFTTKPKGLGLGTEIARRGAEVHRNDTRRGFLEIDSDGQNRGTVVTIWLPA